MLNARKIDKFYLSGGWENLPHDSQALVKHKIKAVLDLQFTPADMSGPIVMVETVLTDAGIEYQHIPMWDGNLGQDIEAIFSSATAILAAYEIRYPDPKDFLMVKCAAGISRSPSTLIAHYCETRRWNYREALDFIRKREQYSAAWQADPNPVFSSLLKRKYGSGWGPNESK